MTYMPKMNRRSFLVGTAAVGGGFSLGFEVPLGPTVVRAQDGSPEINAWVVIRPDDTIVVRIARSEMGQGTLTGLAQLVVEELEGDWSKVTTEYPSPGQNVALSEQQLDGFGGLQGADDAAQDPEHARFLATRGEVRRRGFGVQGLDRPSRDHGSFEFRSSAVGQPQVARDRIDHAHYAALVRAMAEALPWLLPEEPPAPSRRQS